MTSSPPLIVISPLLVIEESPKMVFALIPLNASPVRKPPAIPPSFRSTILISPLLSMVIEPNVDSALMPVATKSPVI